MSLPLSDSALIGTCFAASALGLLVLTSSGGNGNAAPEAQTAEVSDANGTDALAQLGAAPAGERVEVDAEFGEMVRSYLLQNPEVIFEAVAEFESRNAEAQVEMDRAVVAAHSEALFDDPNSWVGGNPEGDVSLVAFIDYRCGYCKRAHDDLEELLATDTDLRLIIKEFPILGPESELASRFAVATLRLGGDEAYESAHDLLMRYDGPITPDYLDDLAGELGLEMEAVFAEMESDAVTEVIASNYQLAQRLEISGTPTFVMEDEMIRGYVDATTLLTIAASKRD